MKLLVDTSVWSLALRRDGDVGHATVNALREALTAGEQIFTTGLVLQELLQGFRGAKAHDAIIARFAVLPSITPERDDHIAAAEIRNTCRRRGVQLATIDALLVHLCVRYELVLLATDRDFEHAAKHVPVRLWSNRAVR